MLAGKPNGSQSPAQTPRRAAARRAPFMGAPRTVFLPERERSPLETHADCLRYRSVTARDLSVVADAFASAYALPPWNESWSRQKAQAYLSELMAAPGARCYVAYAQMEQERMLVAAFFAHRRTWQDGMEWYVDTFFVAPNRQHGGVGSWFLAHMREEARADGARHMALHTGKGYPAERFYQKNGFEASPQTVLMVTDV